MKFFDSAREEIRPEHIMASGALPPGFPPVEIDGEAYWDGGLVSNTPLQFVLDGARPPRGHVRFQIDLFSAKGPVPETLFDIAQREKDIRFSSRTRPNTDIFRDIQTIRRAIRRLDAKMPDGIEVSRRTGSCSHPSVAMPRSPSCSSSIAAPSIPHSRTITNFSRYTVDEHWRDGRDDVGRTLSHPSWRDRERPSEGVAVLDLTKEFKPSRRELKTPGE